MIEREKDVNKNLIKGYHTQESRADELKEPLKCEEDNAWLGQGYYFWLEEKFAHYWGEDSKDATGEYDIYVTWIEYDNLIDATFDEEGYFFWKERIEQTIDKLEELGFDLDLKKVHEFLSENVWSKYGIKGIIFDDLPHNPRGKARTYSEIPPLYYEKRLQLVIY